ncbi:hypothetical protein Efla_000709 [Eimeria flavescens]
MTHGIPWSLGAKLTSPSSRACYFYLSSGRDKSELELPGFQPNPPIYSQDISMVFLQTLVEQLLSQLGSCSLVTTAKPVDLASSEAASSSWRCQLETKYYTANIRATFVQQQEPVQTDTQESLLHDSPEGVIFICSRAEQQELHETRLALSRLASEADGQPAGLIEPLPFMTRIPVVQKKQQDQKQQQVGGCHFRGTGGGSNWWVRDVPLKFILAVHCNPSARWSCCTGSSRSSSASAGDGVDTVVWNICGDVFLEGMELCFAGRDAPAAVASENPTAASLASFVGQQQKRLKKVAEGLQCHMWPGLSRRGDKRGGSGDINHTAIESRSAINEGKSVCSALKDAKNTIEDGRHPDTQQIGHNGEKREHKTDPADREKEDGCSLHDVESFDALAAAMLDLKQRGPPASSEGRRREAMRLAAKLAALTMCDED